MMKRPQQSRSRQGQRGSSKRSGTFDIWRTPGAPPDIEPITIASDVSGLIRSLGDAPVLDGSTASHYFSTVVERAAAIAAALALSADLLAEPIDD